MRRTFLRTLVVLAVLFGFGFAKLRFEQNLTEEHRREFFHGAKFSLGLRQQIGQFGFVAALSGFRAAIADVLYIRAHTAWEATQWLRMAELYNCVTALQPRVVLFWDTAAWHMAYNASVAAREDRRQPREALRIKAQKEFFELGRDFLERGIQNNPDRYQLYLCLGNLYRDKFHDHAKAAEQFRLGAQISDAPSYLHRFAVYELAQVPGKEREAYQRLRALYLKSKDEHLPTLLTHLKRLQVSLQIPEDQRVKIQEE
jgi:hypothetical protein